MLVDLQKPDLASAMDRALLGIKSFEPIAERGLVSISPRTTQRHLAALASWWTPPSQQL